MHQDKTPTHIKLDERNHVEKPLLDQLSGLGWEILDLDSKQQSNDSFRLSFTDVVMLPVQRTYRVKSCSLKLIRRCVA